MRNLAIDRNMLTRYLLGQSLEREEVERIEEEYFSDNAALEEVEDVQDELIDRYVMRDLPPGQDELVHRKIETSERWREKHDLARQLQKVVLEEETPLRRAWVGPGRALATAGLAATVLLAAGLWMWRSRPPAPGGETQPPGTRNVKARLPVPVVSVTLGSPVTRNGQMKPTAVQLPRGEVQVEFRIWLGVQRHEEYRAGLSTPDTQPDPAISVRVEKLPVAGHTVHVKIPSALLPAGLHTLRLQGAERPGQWEAVGAYPFEVIRP